MKTVNQVNETNDYTMFNVLNGNRNVDKLHVKRLINSFKTAYLLSPMIVNEKFEIIDGQHRFEAAKALSLPVRFIIANGYGLEEVQLLNTNMKNWKKIDYLNGYCDLKYPEYLKFRNFMREFPNFGIAACETILTQRLTTNAGGVGTDIDIRGETNKSGRILIRSFQEGDLVIENYELAQEQAKMILEMKPYYEGYNRAALVRTMVGIFRIEYYSHEQFIRKLKNNPSALTHCANIGQYKLLIEDIYNFKSHAKVSLRF